MYYSDVSKITDLRLLSVMNTPTDCVGFLEGGGEAKQWWIQHGGFGANAHPLTFLFFCEELSFSEKILGQTFKFKCSDHLINIAKSLPETFSSNKL